MSVTINWSFTNYSDVESVLICRSEVLDNEKAFEDSLNGITQTSSPDILGSLITSDLTEGLQSFTDSETLAASTTYYYCVAAKGTGSGGLYKVGPTAADASSSPVTSSADGSSSVSTVTTAAESGGGGGAGTDPNLQVGFAFADLLGSYKALYGIMPPTDTGESYPGIKFYSDVFDTELDLVNSYSNSEAIITGYIEGQVTSDKYTLEYGDINDFDLFATNFGTTPAQSDLNRQTFVNRHYTNKYGTAASSNQKFQASMRLWNYYNDDGLTKNQAIATFLYNLATDTTGSYINFTTTPAPAQMNLYKATANDIGVAADAPWSDPN